MAPRTSHTDPDAIPEAADYSGYALVWPVVMALVYAGIGVLIILLL